MAVNVKEEVTQDRINAMVAAGKDGGATPEATPATLHVDDIAPDPAAEESSPAGQPAEKPDPIAALKAEYEARLAERDEELKNVKAQVATSHKRNSEAARDRQLAEERERKAEERDRSADAKLQRMEAMAAGMFQIGKLPPDVQAQVLQTWANDGQNNNPAQFAIGNPQPPQREDPRVAALQQEIAKLKQDVSGYAFEVNAGAVAATIERMVVGNPGFEAAEAVGPEEMDTIRERIWDAFVRQDKENPGAISPHNPRQINDAVKKLVDVEAKRWKRINEVLIKNYREKRKALNAQAGAPTRGPSASVRAAPTPTGPTRGETAKEAFKRRVEAFTNASKSPRNGTAAQEI